MGKIRYRKYVLYAIIFTVIIIAYGYFTIEGFNNTPTVSFISYGNDNFKARKEGIHKEAIEMGCFNGTIKIYEPNDLSEDFKNATKSVLSEKRGGGYWIWKPYIIYDMLKNINENDILVYADAGCTLNVGGVARLKEYIGAISPSTNKSVFAMRLTTELEKKWTSTPIFEYFDEPLNGEFANSNQILATTSIYRKCPESMEFVKRWLQVAQTRPDLFTDLYNDESKRTNPMFSENRHDQSIFSMILKSEPYKNSCVVIDEEIESGLGFSEKSPVKATRLRQ
jgi:hypothetical protein